MATGPKRSNVVVLWFIALVFAMLAAIPLAITGPGILLEAIQGVGAVLLAGYTVVILAVALAMYWVLDAIFP